MEESLHRRLPRALVALVEEQAGRSLSWSTQSTPGATTVSLQWGGPVQVVGGTLPPSLPPLTQARLGLPRAVVAIIEDSLDKAGGESLSWTCSGGQEVRCSLTWNWEAIHSLPAVGSATVTAPQAQPTLDTATIPVAPPADSCPPVKEEKLSQGSSCHCAESDQTLSQPLTQASQGEDNKDNQTQNREADSSGHPNEIINNSQPQKRHLELDTGTETQNAVVADNGFEIPPSDGEVVPDSQLDDSQVSPVIPNTYYSAPSQDSAVNESELPSTTGTSAAEAMFDEESDQTQPLAINMSALDSDSGNEVLPSDSGNEAFPSSQRALSVRSKKRAVDTDSNSDEDFAPSQMSFRSPMKKQKLKRSRQKKPKPKRSKRSLPEFSDDEDAVHTTSPASTQPSRVDSLLDRIRSKRRIQTTTDSESEMAFTREEPVAAMPDIISPKRRQRRSKIDNAEEYVSRAADIITEAQGILESSFKLSSYQRVSAWLKELHTLKAKAHLPETVIAVVGDTGSGKSSIMNALIGHASVLPTSGMRACTAVVVEVKDNPNSKYYEGEIQFLEKEEWNKELETLLKELQGADGRVRAVQPDPNSDLIVAWTKVRAVYGSFTDGVTLQTLPKMNRVTRYLGETKPVRESDPTVFRKKVDSYIESTSGRDGGQFWPIVKKVSLRIPNCTVCSSGATLVDLPGIRDSNAARDKIAKEYLQKCTAVWVVASIHRAVNDKTAKELLGEHFRRQLLMDGQYGSVSFVCTKTDIHSPSELVRNLNLHDEVAPHEDSIDELKTEIETLKENSEWRTTEVTDINRQIRALRSDIKDIKSDLVDIRTILEENTEEDKKEELLAAKRETDELLSQKENELKAVRENGQEQLTEIESNKNKMHDLEMKVASERKTISSICVLARNNYSKHNIKRDFKAGLRDMKRRAGMTDYQEDEEDEFESEGEEDEDILRTTNNLKVFCVSSTEYLKLNRLLPSNDGPAQVFQTVEETGVPALEQHVHMMTGVRRQQGTEQLVSSVHQCMQNVESYLMDEGTKTRRTRDDAKGVIYDEIKRFEKTDLTDVHSETMDEIDNIFSTSLKQKINEGKQTAIERAEATVAKWGSKQSKENKKEGGLHFSTYKATVRRLGVFKSPVAGNIDFNQDLTDPVYASISIVWDRVFNMTLAVHLENFKKHIIAKLNNFVRELQGTLQSIGVAGDRLQRTEQHLKQRVDHKVSVALSEVKVYIADRQREINRVVTPKVQERMGPAYERCSSESGTGTYNRMKGHMERHIANGKCVFFDESSKLLWDMLHKLLEEIAGMLQAIIERVVGDCEQVLEPYWQEPCNTKAFRQAFLQGIKTCLEKICQLSQEAGVTLPQVQQPRSPTPSPSEASDSSAIGSALDEPLPSAGGTMSCGCYSVVSSGGNLRFVNMSGECQIHCPPSQSEQDESDDAPEKPPQVKKERSTQVKKEKPKKSQLQQSQTSAVSDAFEKYKFYLQDLQQHHMNSMNQSKENIPHVDAQRKASPAASATQSTKKRSLLQENQPQLSNSQRSRQRLSLPKTPHKNLAQTSKEPGGVRVKQEPGAPVPKKQRHIDHGVIDLTMSSSDDDDDDDDDDDNSDDLPPMANIFRSSQKQNSLW